MTPPRSRLIAVDLFPVPGTCEREACRAPVTPTLRSRLVALRATIEPWAPHLSAASGVAGLGLLGWLVMRTGPAVLAGHLVSLGPVFPMLLVLSGTRYLLQAAAWRAAMPSASRPGWRLSAKAILASEAVGYVSWAGVIAREPVKLLFVRGLVPVPVALTASIVERSLYGLVSMAIIVLGVSLVATEGRHAWQATLVAGAVGLVGLGTRTLRRDRPQAGPPDADPPAGTALVRVKAAAFLRHRRPVIVGIVALSLVQVVISLAESYAVLAWLGAGPTMVAITAFEGMTKLANGAGSFVPGGIGITEAAGAFASDAIKLGATYGVSLALARRARALVWAGVGLVVLGRHAAANGPTREDPDRE